MTSRREFIQGAASAAALTLAPFGKCGMAQERRVRRNIANLSPNDPILVTYRAAVLAMMARPTSDPLSWYAQAKIHNSHCPHFNWFFLPWHREYLLRFEEIVREIAHDPSFNLPFWDWNTNRQIPLSFWGSDNPLDPGNLNFQPFADADPELESLLSAYGNKRTLTQTDVVGNDIDFSLSRLGSNVLQARTFVLLGSRPATSLHDQPGASFLEGSLHNPVHGDVGGQMNAFFSPLDPIFWLHHANVDRLWTLWQRCNPTIVPLATWRNFVLPAGMFVDGKRNPVPETRCGELERVDTYTYEAVPSQEELLAACSAPIAMFPEALGRLSLPQRANFLAEGSQRTTGRNFVALSVPVGAQALPSPALLRSSKLSTSGVGDREHHSDRSA